MKFNYAIHIAALLIAAPILCSTQTMPKQEQKVALLPILETNQDLIEFLQDNPLVLVYFSGTCEHCVPGRALVHKLALENSASNIRFAELAVVQKDTHGNALKDKTGEVLLKEEVTGKLNIIKRPTIITFYESKEAGRLEKEAISQESAAALLATLAAKKIVAEMPIYN